MDTGSLTGSFDLMDDDLFQMPDKGKQMLGVKISSTLRMLLDSTVKLWKIRARLRAEAEAILSGADPKKVKEEGQKASDKVDLSHVCNVLLNSGGDKAWADVLKLAGMEKIPDSKEEWEQLQAALIKHDRSDRIHSK